MVNKWIVVAMNLELIPKTNIKYLVINFSIKVSLLFINSDDISIVIDAIYYCRLISDCLRIGIWLTFIQQRCVCQRDKGG